MKILVISQYFYPENFRINDLVISLKKRGHYVEVLTGKPNYPKGDYFDGYSWAGPKMEKIHDVKVHRANLILRKRGDGLRLFLNYLSFVFFGFIKVIQLKGRFEKVFVFAPSPITVGILGVIAAKKFKCKSYLWVHDLWPESVQVAGGINNRIILDLVNRMTKLIYKFTDLILIQSPNFKSYIKKQGVAENKIIYYPYYAEEFYKVVKKDKSYIKQFPKGFNLVFAGNIGIAQGFDTIVSAFEMLKDYNRNLVILGDGRDKLRLQKKIKEKGITEKFHFLGSYPPNEMPYYFSCADGLLISLKKADIFSYTIPSKLQSYLACGKPIIGSLDGIGNKIITESNSGFTSSAGNHQLLADNILKLYNLSEADKLKLSNNALNYFESHFNKENLLERIEHILSE